MSPRASARPFLFGKYVVHTTQYTSNTYWIQRIAFNSMHSWIELLPAAVLPPQVPHVYKSDGENVTVKRMRIREVHLLFACGVECERVCSVVFGENLYSRLASVLNWHMFVYTDLSQMMILVYSPNRNMAVTSLAACIVYCVQYFHCNTVDSIHTIMEHKLL